MGRRKGYGGGELLLPTHKLPEKETKELALGFLLATVTTGRQCRLFNGRRSDHHLSLLHQVEEFVRAGEILLWGGVVETSREWGITLPTFSYIN